MGEGRRFPPRPVVGEGETRAANIFSRPPNSSFCGCFGIRFVDLTHRFDAIRRYDSLIRFVSFINSLLTSIRRFNSSLRFNNAIRRYDSLIRFVSFINSLSTQQLRPAECAKRLNPPPPEGSERVWIVFEIVFEFFEIKELSQAPRIPPVPPELAPNSVQNRSKNRSKK